MRQGIVSKRRLMQRIISLSSKIGDAQPALYSLLEESPLFYLQPEEPGIHITDLKMYMDTIKAQLNTFESRDSGMTQRANA